MRNWIARSIVFLLLGPFDAVLGAEVVRPTAEEQAYQKNWDRVQQQFLLPALEARQKGDIEEAIRSYELAAEDWKSKEFSSAELEEQRYTAIVGNFLVAGELNEGQKNFTQAAKDYMECEKIARVSGQRKNGSYLPQAGRAYRQAKDFAKAEETYKILIKKGFCGDTYPNISLAQVYEDEGRIDLAEKTIDDFLNESLKNCKPLDVRAARISLKEMLTRHTQTAEAAKIDAALLDKRCPICSSDSAVVPIAYGLPSGSAKEDMHQGGCVISKYSPQWWCKKDKLAF